MSKGLDFIQTRGRRKSDPKPPTRKKSQRNFFCLQFLFLFAFRIFERPEHFSLAHKQCEIFAQRSYEGIDLIKTPLGRLFMLFGTMSLTSAVL